MLSLGLVWLLGVVGVKATLPAERDQCPVTCKEAGPDPSDWTVIAEFGQLQACPRPLLLDFSVMIPVTTTQQIRVCNVWADDFQEVGTAPDVPFNSTEDISAQLAWTPALSDDEIGGRLASQSVEHLQHYLETALDRAGNRTILFATSSGTTVGVYVGANLLNPSVAENLFQPFLGALWGPGIADSKASLLQACEGRSGNEIFGIIAAASSDFATVQNAVARWSNGTCVDTSSYSESMELESTPISVLKPIDTTALLANSNSTLVSNFTSSPIHSRMLRPRADCRTERVQLGDGCDTLVRKCGISAQDLYKFNPASNLCSTLQEGQLICCSSGTLPKPKDPEPNPDGTCRTEIVDDGDSCAKLVLRCGGSLGGLTNEQFYKFNPKADLCSTLQVGQRVCCTPGNLPDIRPKPNADGSCATYQINDGDFCSKVAVSHGITVQELEKFNEATWGWNGCDYGFWPKNWICVSPGRPRFPSPIDNAVCGPQKLGTTMPAGSTSRDWAKLNPCPLNSCCNTWGQCGTTEDFCIDTNTGPPGTAKKDTYGCISNCGMSIVQSGPPAQFIKLGYFEGWNLQRDCLNMDALQIDPSYTHIHFAFGMIRDGDFSIYQESKDAEYQFERFKQLRGPKRIISFGGWVFSAEAPHYHIFRNAVKDDANRRRLGDNLVKYVADHGLDGLDIDWEYPSAPNLGEGVPEGDPDEAMNYLRLLAYIRSRLPRDKSLSIAAPASHWYLKQFPIKAMSELLDYIVYMTYDLHGQWDAGNKWATPGCPTGNCLRSHVNRTQTMNTLTMITKAGVPSNKVLVGVSSYGRSFQMVDPSCTGPNCFYTGDRLNSNARKGRCTGTAGYISNAEIAEIGGRQWVDAESNSRIMVDGDLWVAYMDDALKASRTNIYKNYNMGGTIDWAVDLVKFHDPPALGPGGINLGHTWSQIKALAKVGQEPGGTCQPDARTGNWASPDFHCNLPLVKAVARHTPKERWDGLECSSAWKDVLRRWYECRTELYDQSWRFTHVVADFLHFQGKETTCEGASGKTNCEFKECAAHNSPGTENSYRTGACAYEIWNSIARVHAIIYNFNDALKRAGDEVSATKDTFMETFAPRPEPSQSLAILMSLIQIPMGIAASRFFGGSLLKRAFFAGDASGNKQEAWEQAASGLIGFGFDMGKEAVKEEADKKPRDMDFKELFTATLGSWKAQTDKLMKKIFDGSNESIEVLSNLFSDGKLISGKADGNWEDSEAEHTEGWLREKSVARAFYAMAIPGAWAANKPTPVVLDFGPTCQIDARKYFSPDESRKNPPDYNTGWRCPGGRSYILAGVEDEPIRCNSPNPRQCALPRPNYFKILKGIDQLQGGDENKNWGDVNVEDLIVGAVNTFNDAGGKNDMAIKDMRDSMKGGLKEMRETQLDVRKGGIIRIPKCSPEEAYSNFMKGRKAYGDSPNYPCNP
ncbi:hypothetical protein PspLS_09441 [Pyricularia sp. CBS 133598]|nr:hypothetical protein PspLS_09441 [Pyricularia sp. CBS 133598]